MKIKSLFAIVLAVGLLPAVLANAADMKIGVVDVKSAIENTRAYQKGLNRIRALATKKQKELDALRVQIEQADKALFGQTMAMSPERLAQKQSEIKALKKLYSRKEQDAREEIVGEQGKLQSAQGIKLSRTLKAFGKKGGYDIILPKAQFVLYSNPAHDITSEITKLLDK